MWVVFLTVAACVVAGILIWLGHGVRKQFGEVALIGMCTFATGVVSFLVLVFLVMQEVLG